MLLNFGIGDRSDGDSFGLLAFMVNVHGDGHELSPSPSSTGIAHLDLGVGHHKLLLP
jgi:hypothetical protein